MRFLFYLAFFGGGILALTFGHLYIWRRLVRDTGMRGWSRRALTIGLVFLAVWLPASLGLAKRVDPEWMRWGSLLGVLWMGVALYLILFLVGMDILRYIRTRWRRARKEVSLDTQRRAFMANVVAGSALVGAGAVTGIAVHQSGEILKPQIPVKLEKLPPALSGLKIVQISDLHIGPVLDDHFLKTIVAEVNAMKPDLVAITGDLVDAPVTLIGHLLRPLSTLQSRYGTYFVTGNHEYYSDAQGWIPFLESLGVRVLTNECVSIGDEAKIDLVGIPDTRAHIFLPEHRSDLTSALVGRDPERALVLLAHRPNDVVEATRLGVNLQLSGHTHGGQFWPVVPLVGLVHKYSAGLHSHSEQTQIYVSRGTGYWGPPMRLGAPAEITTIHLTA